MDTATLAAIARPHVDALGGGFMFSKPTRAVAEELGIDPWAWYLGGRCGVLGDVDAGVVHAAVVFFEPGWVRRRWEEATAAQPAAALSGRYAEACATWGRRKLADTPGLDRLDTLLARVVDEADTAGRPLFAGWRALPRPDDAPGRVALHLQTLREHRGNGHALAVLAQGLRPLEALVAGRYGAGNAAFFEWPEPYPDPEHHREAMARAEAATDLMDADAWSVLDEAEADEVCTLLDAAAAAAAGATGAGKAAPR